MNKSSVLSYSVIYEEAPEGGYVVRAPALPGCHTQGETIEEAEKNIKEAIELYLESLNAHDEKIPQERRIFQSKVDVQFPFV
ncbi:type II toxin-antitoxin system HicB family antitoxin [Candidatus Daviesbacteria bacterium]|nr:type II toxin-antitoxin system HicB family antitoxin [Candidatus Daviesbacteria bacterium]